MGEDQGVGRDTHATRNFGGRMADYTLEHGKRYKANITLGLLQSLAPNEMVAEKLRQTGFADVSVTGSGQTRVATGTWDRATVSGAIPDEISDVTLLA